MGIKITYGDPGITGLAGFASGMGKGRQFLMNEYLPLARQQLQLDAHRQDLERGYQEQYLRDLAARNERFDRDLWMADQRAIRDENIAGRQEARDQRAAERQTANMENRFGYRTREAEDQFNRRMLRDQLGSLEKGVAGMETMGQQQLSPEGKQRWGELARDLQNIRAQQGKVRPEQYAQLLREWQQRFNGARLNEKVIREPTPDELWAKHTYVDPATGKKYSLGTRNGNVNIQPLDKGQDQEAQTGKELQQIYADLTTRTKDNATRKETIVTPSEEAVRAEYEKRKRIRDAISGQAAAARQQQAPQQSPYEQQVRGFFRDAIAHEASGRQLANPGIVSQVAEEARSRGLDPNKIYQEEMQRFQSPPAPDQTVAQAPARLTEWKGMPLEQEVGELPSTKRSVWQRVKGWFGGGQPAAAVAPEVQAAQTPPPIAAPAATTAPAPTTAVSRAIAAARAGDVSAQQALEKRGIRWQQ
jgi:hypothetical protein